MEKKENKIKFKKQKASFGQIVLLFYLIRCNISIFIAESIFPNATNFIEATFYDMLPMTIFIISLFCYMFISKHTIEIYQKYSQGKKWYGLCYFIPFILINIIMFLSTYETINAMNQSNLEKEPMPMNIFAYTKLAHDCKVWLQNNTFLGWNALGVVKSLVFILAFAIIITSIVLILHNLIKIIFNKENKIKEEKDRIKLTALSLILLFVNLSTLTLIAIYCGGNLFEGMTLSENFFLNLFESVYITLGNLTLFVPYQPINIISKILVMFTIIVNILFFTIFLTSLFNKNIAEEPIISNKTTQDEVEYTQTIEVKKKNNNKSNKKQSNKKKKKDWLFSVFFHFL